MLVARGRAREAVALLRDAPPHQAGSPELLAKLGVALREAGDLAVGRGALERARAGGAENPELANDLGVVYAAARDAPTMPGRSFRSCSAATPTMPPTWNNLGRAGALVRRGPTQAAAAFRHAVEADPARGDAWQGLGAALVERDRPAAIDAWRRAERLLPHDYDLLFNLGVVLADESEPARGAALSRAVRPRGAARPLRRAISRASRP